MIKSRKLLEKELENKFSSELMHKKTLVKWIKQADEEYKMPEKISSDYITMRKTLVEADTFTLFILTDIVFGMPKLKEFFAPAELKQLAKEEWYIEKVSFPLKFDMTRINDSQYIGKISVKELMLLKDAQLINYNENAQRTMKHIVKGETEYFQIALNKEAVRAIMNSYESDLYIPNTITLNLPEEADYSYDEKKKQLVIHSLKYFDILDGYHRYIAMSKIYSQDPEFDYEMELRIVRFEESKAKRFIWQEDQKTKMRKVDSDSMDSAKVSNKIVDRINNDSRFILSGKVSRNKGIINASYLANIIEVVLLKGIRKSDELAHIKLVSGTLMNDIEWWVDGHPQFLSTPWDKKLIYMLIYEGKYGDLRYLEKDLNKVWVDKSIYAGPTLTNADVIRTHKLLGREGY